MVSFRGLRRVRADKEVLHGIHVVDAKNKGPTVIASLVECCELFLKEFVCSSEGRGEVAHIYWHQDMNVCGVGHHVTKILEHREVRVRGFLMEVRKGKRSG
jgi:hypothetical protein